MNGSKRLLPGHRRNDIFLILIAIQVIIGSTINCTSPADPENIASNNYSLLKLDPTNIFGSDYIMTSSDFPIIRRYGNQMKIPPVKKGFDSLQVRIWVIYQLSSIRHLLTLSGDSSGWKGELIEFSSNELKSEIIKVSCCQYSSKTKRTGSVGW